MSRTCRFLGALPLLVLLVWSGSTRADVGDVVPDEWLTVAERSGFRATSSYEETLAFIRRSAAAMPEIRLDFYGISPQGRPMPVVIVAKDRGITPSGAAVSGKAVVLVQNGIHSGEIDGKDASLMILRDMVLGRHRELLDELILLIVPIYNVDGHERVSPYNRANQNGPELGMGFRTTADGHDLNRDHLKLDTPEARAVIGLFNTWRPHLHVDDHVTNGADHDWVLTYTWVEKPQLAPPLHDWVEAHLPTVVSETERAGHRVGPYVSLLDRDDPSAGFDSYVGEPRYATGYYPLRNRPSILVENHAYKPYGDRVLANRDFLLALFGQVASGREELIRAVQQAETLTVALGRGDADPSDVALAYEVAPASEKIRFPVYAWYSEPSEAMGIPLLRYRRGEVRETEVPWRHRPRIRTSVARPRGYLVLPGWPAIERRLLDHDLRVLELTEGAEIEAETIRISNPRQDGRSQPSYQGRTRISVDVSRSQATHRVPAGALWIPADQPDFEVAVQLLEAEAPDSLVSWGLLSSVLERKEYIDPRALEGLASEMLQDETVRAEWEAALRDEGFAADASARWTWWYRRTKYWDGTVGLMPVLRVMAAPNLATEPWRGPDWSAIPPPQPGPVR